jgi:hypothetical protein
MYDCCDVLTKLTPWEGAGSFLILTLRSGQRLFLFLVALSTNRSIHAAYSTVIDNDDSTRATLSLSSLPSSPTRYDTITKMSVRQIILVGRHLSIAEAVASRLGPEFKGKRLPYLHSQRQKVKSS